MAAPLIACHECDLLQRETAVPPGGTARCARCDAVLYRNRPDSLNRSLAFAVGAAVFFVIANAFPLVGLEVQGERVQTTLFGAALALLRGRYAYSGCDRSHHDGRSASDRARRHSGLLLPLQFERMPRGSAIVFRILRAVQAWRMPDVMFIGVLVALVKLTHLAEVIPGIALFSLAAFMILLAACVSTFNPRALWASWMPANDLSGCPGPDGMPHLWFRCEVRSEYARRVLPALWQRRCTFASLEASRAPGRCSSPR